MTKKELVNIIDELMEAYKKAEKYATKASEEGKVPTTEYFNGMMNGVDIAVSKLQKALQK